MTRVRPCSVLAKAGALLLAAAVPSIASAETDSLFKSTGTPEGFGDLEQPRELLVDVYFGNRKLGSAWIVARPGFVRFKDPNQLFTLLPELKPSPALSAQISSELPDHAALACPEGIRQGCGSLDAGLAEVIFDEARFRLDLFIGQGSLAVAADRDPYLPVPTAGPSLTSSTGGAVAGSSGGRTNYNFQNRTIIGFENARIRSDSAYASGLGFIVDDFVAEMDTKRHRYSAGLFWAPGIDLTGRRRIAGVGFSTQFDTRADQDNLEATPLILFLAQPSRVEILIDGRLVTSAAYEAGNKLIDSSALPNGSYSLVLRVREPGGTVRDERRFFVKNAQVAPEGHPIYFAYAGLLANTRRNRPVSLSNTVYYQLGAAYRLSDAVAIDGGIIGAGDKPIAQFGGWLITNMARMRAAGLVSADGDTGLLLQLGSAGTGRLNFNADVRRVWSRNGDPLVPLPTYIDNFGRFRPWDRRPLKGSYTQAVGSLTYSLRGAFMSLTGSYRHDKGEQADYSIGPGVTWPVYNRGGLQLILNADAQRSRTTTAAFAGVRLIYTSGAASLVATSGVASLDNRNGGPHRSRPVGSLSAQYFHEDENRTQVTLEGAAQRDVEATTALVNAQVASRLGTVRADVLHGFEGRSGTQYGVNFQTGIAIGSKTIELGGRDLNQSAVIISLKGAAGAGLFDILIDGVPRPGSARAPACRSSSRPIARTSSG